MRGRKAEIQKLEAQISAVAADIDAHICRDDGYCPYTRQCPRCMTQLCLLSQLNHLRN